MPNKDSKTKNVYDIILSRRSIRRFKQKPIKTEILKKFVNAARLAPSAANLQPLEFLIVNDGKLSKKIFKTIGWAGYLPDWSPTENEKPTAYIILLVKNTTNKWYLRDVSLASENIVIAAESERIGSCILLNIKKEKIRDILKIPKDIEIDSVIALGYKLESPVVEDLVDSVKYWKDEKQVLHVPKRKLEDIVHINKY